MRNLIWWVLLATLLLTLPAQAISSITNPVPLPLGMGGTGAVTAGAARTNLGVALGVDVQAYSANLSQLLTGTAATPQFAKLGLGVAPSTYSRNGQVLDLQQTAGNNGGLAMTNWSAGGNYPLFDFNLAKNNTPGTYTLVSNNNSLGLITWRGADGSAFKDAAAILGVVDGNPAANDMPGRLEFYTTAASASSGTLRFMINKAGNIFMYNLTTSGSAQTSNLCLSSGNEVIADSVGCLPSSARFKQDITPLTDLGLQAVLALTPVSFHWKPTDNPKWNVDPNRSGPQIGFIAEEAQKVDPRLVEVDSGNLKQVRTFRYESYTAVLTKAIQEQQRQIEALFQAKTYLESRIDTLEARLAAIEVRVLVPAPKPTPKPKATPKRTRTGWHWPWEQAS